MDENILTNDSREEDESAIQRTPGNTKINKSINQINQGVFNNQAGKKSKATAKVINNTKANSNSILGKSVTTATTTTQPPVV